MCTIGDLCSNGICRPGLAKPCDDFNPCTDDTCDTNTGNCVFTNDNNNSCEDNDPCSVNTCSNGQCITIPFDCEDNNICTNDICLNGGCVYSFNQRAPCDDGDYCTENDICINGICQGDLINCAHANPCITGICTHVYGQAPECKYSFNHNYCDDGNACTIGDKCEYGVCVPGNSINCNDGLFCNGVETCNPINGTCTLGTPVDCGNCQICNETLNACVDRDFIGEQCGLTDIGACQYGSYECDINTGEKLCIGDIIPQPESCGYNNTGNGIDEDCDGHVDEGCGIICAEVSDCDIKECYDVTCENYTCIYTGNNDLCDDGNPCTNNDTCQYIPGTHVTSCFGAPIICPETDINICTSDVCDPNDGQCKVENNNELCDDGNACTSFDTCVDGECLGTLIRCTDNNPCTDDSCDPNIGCVNTNNNEVCEDGDPCTIGDYCSNGICIPGQQKDCNDNNDCTIEYCNPNNGNCIYQNSNQTYCNDGDICTTYDMCINGQCIGQPKDCDDGQQCTIDFCDQNNGYCAHYYKNMPCDDGNPCTTMDVCVSGICKGRQIDCDDGNQCTIDSCNPNAPPTNMCVHILAQLPCNDGNPCTVNDTCHYGQDGTSICQGEIKNCDDNNECTEDICSTYDGGLCVHQVLSNITCDDGNPCTLNDTCVNGQCSGILKNCDDNNACTDDFCDINNGECVNINDNTNTCNDNDLCTINDRCESGQCASDQVICRDGNICTNDICNPMTGQCDYVNNNMSCDDMDPCTVDDTCRNGQCIGLPKNCNDYESCTIDSCDPINGNCINEILPDWTHCNDMDNCTLHDLCKNGICTGVPVNCNDGNICTDDVCNQQTGECDAINHMRLCDDGDICTINDRCINGECIGDPAINCDDNNECTSETCAEDPQTGMAMCFYKDITGYCDDGDLCTLNDTCIEDMCIGTPMVCMDSPLAPCVDNPCVNGVCTPMNNTSQTPCDDGNPCTHSDICNNGICQGTPIDCDDGNPCTNNTCVDGMCYLKNLNGTHCYDNDHCTFNDTCIEGPDGASRCIGTRIVCEDGNPCTDNECLDGICIFSNNTQPCDDGDLCTYDDRCVMGQCVGTPITCDDYNECTRDECVNGNCEHFIISTAYCDDGDNCTHLDMCVIGQDGKSMCVGTPIDCNDGNVCTTNECDPQTGECVVTNNDMRPVTCDDGDICTDHDVCVNGTCQGVPMDCNDYDPCTEDICSNGNCFHRKMYYEPCDDNNLCTVNDTCIHAPKRDNSEYLTCVGTPKNCNDGNICTEDTCNPSTGNCETTNNMMSCDDNNPCTENDTCQYGICTGTQKDCSDDNICTFGMCDIMTGNCMYSFLNITCDDMNPCTSNDFCVNGVCTGTDVDCNDGDVCTINDRCNPSTGECEYDLFDCDDGNECTSDICIDMDGPMCFTKFINNGQYCDDGNLCTDHDVCMEGPDGVSMCVGIEKTCGNGNVCTSGTCDPNTGECTVMHNNDPCDDGNYCTENDVCNYVPGQGGICLGAPIYCNDNNICTDDLCDPRSGCVFTPNTDPCYVDDKEGWCSQGRCQINCLIENGCDPNDFTFSWNSYYDPVNNAPLIGDELITARTVQNYNSTHNKISKEIYSIPVGNDVIEFVESSTLSQNDTTVLAFLVEDDGDTYFFINNDSEESYDSGYVELIIFEGDLRGDLVYKSPVYSHLDTHQWLSSIGYGRFVWYWYERQETGLVIGPIPQTKVMCFTLWFRHVEYINQISIASFNNNTYEVEFIPGPSHPKNTIIHVCRTNHIDDYVLPSYLPTPEDYDDKYCDPEISNEVLALTVVIRDFHKDHPDFDGSYLGPDFGIVKDKLGYDSKPIYASNTKTPSTKNKQSFKQWFTDVQGVNKKKEITLEFIKVNGVYIFQSTEFFPIDDLLFGNEGYYHNYHFTGEVHSNFTYQGGEVFKVGSYDDLFLYINGKLVVNFGGVGSLDIIDLSLDSIATLVDIKVGDIVRFDLFFTQRHSHYESEGSGSGIYFGTSCNINNCFCLDDCAMCNGNNQICRGCDGVINSGLVYDKCGICDGYNNACDCKYGLLKNKDNNGISTCMCVTGWGGESCDICGHPKEENKKYICMYIGEDDDLAHLIDNSITQKLPFKYQKEAITKEKSSVNKQYHYSFNNNHKKPRKLSKYDLIVVNYDELSHYMSNDKYILPDSYGKDGIHYDCRCMPYGFNYTNHWDDLFHDMKDYGDKSNNNSHSDNLQDTIFASIWVILIIIVLILLVIGAIGGGVCYKYHYHTTTNHENSIHFHHTSNQTQVIVPHHIIIGQNKMNKRTKSNVSTPNNEKTIISTQKNNNNNNTPKGPKLKLVPEKMK
jgi:fibro-slime domain-containing protein